MVLGTKGNACDFTIFLFIRMENFQREEVLGRRCVVVRSGEEGTVGLCMGDADAHGGA